LFQAVTSRPVTAEVPVHSWASSYKILGGGRSQLGADGRCHLTVRVIGLDLEDTAGPVEQYFLTFVRPHSGKPFFRKTRARSQQIYS